MEGPKIQTAGLRVEPGARLRMKWDEESPNGKFAGAQADLTIEYACNPLPEGLRGIYIDLCDAAGHSLSINGGQNSLEADGKRYWACEVRPFDELPGALYLKPDAVDGPPMGSIECKLREVSAPVVTMPPSQGDGEATSAALKG